MYHLFYRSNNSKAWAGSGIERFWLCFGYAPDTTRLLDLVMWNSTDNDICLSFCCWWRIFANWTYGSKRVKSSVDREVSFINFSSVTRFRFDVIVSNLLLSDIFYISCYDLCFHGFYILPILSVKSHFILIIFVLILDYGFLVPWFHLVRSLFQIWGEPLGVFLSWAGSVMFLQIPGRASQF